MGRKRYNLLAGMLVLLGVVIFVLEILAVSDLRKFEYKPLLELLGPQGLAFITFLNVGLATVTFIAFRKLTVYRNRSIPIMLRSKVFVLIWCLSILWLLEWVFMEIPLTVRLANNIIQPDTITSVKVQALSSATSRGDLSALRNENRQTDETRLAIILARVVANRPDNLVSFPIGETIAEYARRYGVSRVLLVYFAYLTSWTGEAESGPMPFFRQITSETFRDLIQAHVPWWISESPVRLNLVKGSLLETIAGQSFGNKLRYAFQKATYDISQDPYSANTFSDVFIVLKHYKNEFPELFGSNPISDPIAKSFLVLEDHLMLEPYGKPYEHKPRNAHYYIKYRQHIISFARAVMYRLALDFRFATKVQALVVKHYYDAYSDKLGESWNKMSEIQRLALIAMVRDVYVPNIGHMGYNLYILPEFNWASFEAMSSEARAEAKSLYDRESLWRPSNPARFWGGTAHALTGLAEVWKIMTGQDIPGIRASNTTPAAIDVLTRHW